MAVAAPTMSIQNFPISSSGNYLKFPDSNLYELPEFSGGKFPDLIPLEKHEHSRIQLLTREIYHGLASGASLEGLVGAVHLGVGLLHQRRPELVRRLGVHEHEFAEAGGEVVVDHNVHPLAVLPESERPQFIFIAADC